MSSVRIVITVVSILLGVAFGYWLTQSKSTPDIQTAMIYPSPLDLPEFSLVDSSGQTVQRSSFVGEWQLVFFGFTYCPDICPTTLQTLVTARKEAAADLGELSPEIVLVSVDPERDSVGKLAEYTAYFGDNVRGLTGELEEIRKLTEGLSIFFQKVELEQGGYTVDHSSVVLIVNPAGQVAGLFSAPHSPKTISSDLRALILR